MFFIIFLNKRSKFLFHFFNYSFVWILIYYFCQNLQTILLQIGRVSVEPVISHLTFSACLTKKCDSSDINFGRWPTVTDSLLVNAIAYLSWTKDCGSFSYLADKTEPIGASQNDLKVWYPRTQQFTPNTNSFSRKISISSSNNISLATVLTPSLYTL